MAQMTEINRRLGHLEHKVDELHSMLRAVTETVRRVDENSQKMSSHVDCVEFLIARAKKILCIDHGVKVLENFR